MRGIDKLFRFDQLSREAQVEAIYNVTEATIKAGYFYADESINSLFEFAKILGTKVTDFNINFYDITEKSYCKFKKQWKYKEID